MLYDLFDELLCEQDDPDDLRPELVERAGTIRCVSTFAEAGILTTDKGLVIEYDDGTTYQLTIARSA